MKEEWIKPGEQFIVPTHQNIRYSGRVDTTNPKQVTMYYPSSYVAFRFHGNTCRVLLENKKVWWDNYLGCIIDGEQKKYKLQDEGEECIDLAESLGDGEHSILLFKRMDGCHSLAIKGFFVQEDSPILKEPLPNKRRIVVFGDSVSAGEVSEAVEYVGKEDPAHNGEYSNSWYSYAWMTARNLHAELHNISQGGIALMNHTGYFGEPNAVGMIECYDKLNYHAALGEVTPWNIEEEESQVVIVAIGQNDSYPRDWMAEDMQVEHSLKWKETYYHFVNALRKAYPRAHIILKTTILNHHVNWDIAIEEVYQKCNDPKIHHFLYSNNGKGTPGHIRIQEAEKMAEELTNFIEGLGEEIWE